MTTKEEVLRKEKGPTVNTSRNIDRREPASVTRFGLRVASFLLGLLLCLGATGGCSNATCKEDDQCGAQETCKAGQCVKKEPQTNTCNKDSDCQSGEACNAGKCGPPPAGCKADSDCKADEVCQGSKCAKAECTKDADCAGKTKPYCSTARACEWECKEDSHCPAGARCTSNRCSTDALACQNDADCADKERKFCSDQKRCEWQCTQDAHCPRSTRCQNHTCQRREGVECNQEQKCSSGELCWNHRCKKLCTLFKETPENGCKTGESCQMVAERGICLSNCDPEKQACPKGSYCRTISECETPGGGTCACTDPEPQACEQVGARPVEYLRQPVCVPVGQDGKNGVRERGESCDPSKGLQQDCAWTLRCSPAKLCRQICYPGQETTCPTGETCVDLRRIDEKAPIEGLCLPNATQQEGDPCQLETKRCVDGFFCKNGTCAKITQQEGDACNNQNPCVAGLVCMSRTCGYFCDPWRERHTNLTCVRPCNPLRGKRDNPACKKDQRCLPAPQASLGGQCATLGKEGETCHPTQLPCEDQLLCQGQELGTCKKAGFKKAGERCSDEPTSEFQRCLPGYFCSEGLICEKECDPYNGVQNNPSCGTNEICRSLQGLPTASLLQGKCIAPGKQQEGQTCNGVDDRCAAGLLCNTRGGSVCAKPCDPQQGLTTNPGCPGAYCSSLGDAGACVRLPQALQGPKELDQSCTTKQTGPGDELTWCNGQKGLFCYQTTTQGVCKKSCTPKKTGECASTEDCIEEIRSPTGGVCLPKATQQEGDSCALTQKVCQAGLFCVAGRCTKPCNPYQGQHNNPACDSKQRCLGGLSVPTGHQGSCYTPNKSEGETCEKTADCKVSLTCFQKTCTKECDLRQGKDNNPACPTSHACIFVDTPLADAPAGKTLCLPKATRKEGESCNQTSQRCLATLFCLNGSCSKRTQKAFASCIPAKTACLDGLFCYPFASPFGMGGTGWCAKSCNPSTEQNNPSCAPTETCYPTQAAPYGGVCAPQSSPTPP